MEGIGLPNQLKDVPVEADLERLGTRTLLLASTDVLRYLPFAALQDGEGRCLVERYAPANWLAAAPDPMPRQQAVSWQVAALGVVTRAQPGFLALPGIRREILGIVVRWPTRRVHCPAE